MRKILLGILLAAWSILACAQAPAHPDAKGCSESKVVTRMPGCWIMRCEAKDFASAEMPRTQAERGHVVEGQFEHTVYRCPSDKSPLELGRNTEAALKSAGYDVAYTYVYGNGARFYMTAHKAPVWVKLGVVSDAYELTVVKEQEMEQQMQANAEGWTKQVEKTGRVTLYGIEFDTGKATIRPDSEATLNEVLKMLQVNPDWAMVVAGHTDNIGAPAMNLTLSRERAASVIAWLGAHGIEASRLASAGFGDTRPIAPNDTDEGRQKNRRVDLVRLY